MRGDVREWIKKNLIDLIAVIGITSVSTGCFLIDARVGFIATGLILVGVAFLLSRDGD